MKKLLNSNIFLIIITIVVFATGTVIARGEYIATDIGYTRGGINNVDAALKDLHTKSKTYKKLSTTTTVKQTDLLKGVTAYNNSGNLITGVSSTNCVTGSIVWTQNYINNGYMLLNYVPSILMVESRNTNNESGLFYYNVNKDSSHIYLAQNPSSGQTYKGYSLTETVVKINDNNVRLTYGSGRLNKTIYYMACR